ncbi:MAG TPA: tetratricopeptide repeat protein [Candidatus Acidoferrum sp.]|nr:tetratricopeptide repeat protein [Candidatus Acidoferrum sp.]
MVVCPKPVLGGSRGRRTRKAKARRNALLALIVIPLVCVLASHAQNQAPNWQAQVRKYAEAKDWDSALWLVEQEIARAPQDMDVRAWRARVLAWSGKLPEAEKEYLEILKVSRTDPDNWMGLASVYLREGKLPEAQRAISTAEELDPKRPDIHAARARILRAVGQRKEAQSEFQSALHLDPGSAEAREGMVSVRRGAQHELRIGQDNDLLSYSDGFHDEWLSVVSQWSSHWTTSAAGNFYQRSGVEAGKFVGSITRRQSGWGALTVGGAVGHDNAVIPKSEAFFDLDHGWKIGETGLVRGVEFDYAQHWYWYQSARILSLTGTTHVYFPQNWTFTLGTTGSRSAFSGTSAEWRPSGIARLGFPLARWGDRRLSGNTSFAAGTENFAIVDQIGSFASQTYGGGLRLQITDRQDLTGFAGYQKRTQNRTDTIFGMSYGIHF